MNRRLRRIFSVICIILVISLLGGCGGTQISDVRPDLSSKVGFSIPGSVSIEDFNWYFNSRNYDKSQDEALTDPYAIEGVWEVAMWVKPDKKSQAVKDLYWINIDIDESTAPPMYANGDIDAADAAEMYGFYAWNEDEDAISSGLAQPNTGQQILDLLAEGDGTIKAHATLIHEGRVNENNEFGYISDPQPIELEGFIYPKNMYFKVEDSKGNIYSATPWSFNSSEQHGVGAYFPANNDMSLSGAVLFTRKVK